MFFLFDAVLENDLEKVRITPDEDVKEWRSFSYDTSLLYYARTKEMVELLVEKGLDPNHASTLGSTQLHICGNVEVLGAMIAAGANVNAKDQDGRLPIMRNKNLPAFTLLIEQGSDLPHRFILETYAFTDRAFSAQILWNVLFV
jgi:ankyrin repeat protein